MNCTDNYHVIIKTNIHYYKLPIFVTQFNLFSLHIYLLIQYPCMYNMSKSLSLKLSLNNLISCLISLQSAQIKSGKKMVFIVRCQIIF